MTAVAVIFWLCVLAVFYSYVLYPLILQLIVFIKGRKTYKSYEKNEQLPSISILIAAFNEELVIEQKLRSIFNTTYPKNKIEVWIGSDNSTDNTNAILEKLSNEYSNLHFINFHNRQGKISIINQLSDKANGAILIISDANVIFEENTLFELTRFFADEQIGLVDTHMKNYGFKRDGISIQEKSYISYEVKIKNLESSSFGTMIGPFGGCYAVRKELFTKVPINFMVDDFFVCMKVLISGKDAINNMNAIVYEDVSNNLNVEFRRKIRIAAGNFQNLRYFKHLILTVYKGVSYCFISHKVLRWLGPFFIIGAFISNLILAL
ncbi:MAG TPA: glycosyltransferase, partial [Bacteroidales bacterium]